MKMTSPKIVRTLARIVRMLVNDSLTYEKINKTPAIRSKVIILMKMTWLVSVTIM